MGGSDHDADPGDLAHIWYRGQPARSLEGRLDQLSGALVGRPYLSHPLVGGPDLPERLVTRLDGFDCVTYVETVWALASCGVPADFPAALMELRYEHADVGWSTRNHYTSDWIARNVARGAAVRVGEPRWVQEPAARTLSCLAGYPPRERQMRYLPLERVDSLRGEFRTGDLVGFVSVRPDLDTFHVGLLVRGEPVRIRHAARSAAQVCEEPLEDFLGRNETPGLLFARLRADAEPDR
jgi:N-acetylmuramoyl-L-alanine amidase-like